jgi:hypothetical protein
MAKNFPRSPVETSTKSPQSDGAYNPMNTVTHKILENRNWRELYKAAIRGSIRPKSLIVSRKRKAYWSSARENVPENWRQLGRGASCGRRNVHPARAS